MQQLAYPNGQTSNYSYLANTGDRRLQEIHHKTSGGATLSKFGYAYDAVGNITTWTQQHEAVSRAYDFAYDPVDQLVGASYRTTDAVPSLLARYGYVYDKVGNRTTAQVDDAPRVFGFNAANQMITQAGGGALRFEGTVNEPATVTVQGQTAVVGAANGFAGTASVGPGTPVVTVTATDGSGNTASQAYEIDVTDAPGTFVYDLNGNLTTHGTKTYEWDAENRLVRALDTSTEVARFTYDGLGRRADKISGGVTRAYVYDGEDIVEERAGGATTRIVHGPGIDQPLAAVTGSTPTYYLADHLGSIAQHTNSAQQVTLTRSYDPFGNLTSGGSSSGYAFTGREWDAEIGLYYYRARYYDAGLGRFISGDPIGHNAGPNFYSYVLNNPVRYIDPLGLDVAVIYGGPAGWNRFGHIAIAVTGEGVYSSGTKESFGSSAIQYLKNQAEYRDTIVYLIKTTPEQDRAVLKAFKDAWSEGHSALTNNCSDIVGAALKAGGVLGENAWTTLPGMINGAMQAASHRRTVYQMIEILQGNQDWQVVENLMGSFNKR